MILDTSAVLAVVLGEDDAVTYLAAMTSAAELSISAATLVECLMVAHAWQGAEAEADVHGLLADLEVDVRPFTEDETLAAVEGWLRFGKGRHAAGLNLGDCFSYGAAQAAGRRLLFKGDDFSRTDVPAALLR